ncbi:thioesterase [Comamonas serinivorans]|uniref:Thioesterase n=1 Tax=Comamonas serinivorans TaxID=1082851 RepID=A0A1Y0ER29_9BURK|nr:thioesterase family protein [Comamonas serinivorans]ARU05958.1 thioesterase [Comamonas serinivorans]
MQASDFPIVTTDKVRYNDTDRQGHVNNAVFATFMELARVEVLERPELALSEAGTSFVLARLAIDYRAEIHWPGEVQIATRVGQVGRSSIAFEQAIFQHGQLCGHGQSVVVLVDGQTKRSRPLSEAARDRLERHRAPADGPEHEPAPR